MEKRKTNSQSGPLLKTISAHGAFLANNFYIQAYNRLPSVVPLNLPLDKSKANIDTVLECLEARCGDLEVKFKGWSTASEKDADRGEDYPNEFFFQSRSRELCVKLVLWNEYLDMDFLYNPDEPGLERRVLATMRKMRNSLGKARNPVFKVLSRCDSGFYTEPIDIHDFKVDIAAHYNEDFREVDGIIREAVAEDSSGLILFHGPPGTGKTSYIKSLVCGHRDKQFIFIPNDFVNELLQPSFVSFLIANKSAVLVIEDAEKVITARDQAQGNSVVSTILQLTDGLFSDYLNIKVICTFNTSLDRIDKALLRKGRMIAFYEFRELSLPKTNALLRTQGFSGSEVELTLAEIFNFGKKAFDTKANGKMIGFKR